MRSKIIPTIALMLFSVNCIWADQAYLGYTGYIYGSSKAIGMGGAFTGIADDVNSLVYNPAGFVFSEFKNFAAVNRVEIIDKSLDLDKNSTDDIWRSNTFTLGYMHRTKKENKFTWGIYIYNFHNMEITNDISQKEEQYILNIGNPQNKYEIRFGLTGIVFPFIWQHSEKLALGINLRFINPMISYIEEGPNGEIDLKYEEGKPRLEFSSMFKINDKLNFGVFFRPAMHLTVEKTLNDQLTDIKPFKDFLMPMELNLGLGYKYSKQFIFDFDIHYAVLRGDEILVGSNLLSNNTEYKLARSYMLTPHLGGEYKTIFMKRDLFLRGGYYYRPNLFETLPSQSHYTFSISWRAIKLPKWTMFEYLSIGYSKDIAKDYNVQIFTLSGDF